MLKLWEILSVTPDIDYESLMKLDVNSTLTQQLGFEEEFGMSDTELTVLSQRYQLFFCDVHDITRLVALYLLHVDEKKVREEFIEYLDSSPLHLAVKVVKYLPLLYLKQVKAYFVYRMPIDNAIDYIRELRELDLDRDLMTCVIIEAIKYYTKNYDPAIVSELVKFMSNYDSHTGMSNWVPAVVPYGQDWLLDYLKDDFGHSDMLGYIYNTALTVGKHRLSYIIDYIGKHRSYQDQLRAYIDNIEFELEIPENYGVIVMTLSNRLCKRLLELDFHETTFQTWKMKVLDGQV